MSDYAAFLEAKSQASAGSGFAPVWLPDFLFDFQRSLVEWAIRQGRAAIFADCGLGKTPMQLVWAENVVRQTNGRVLILTPLAVGAQTVREAEKFGIEATDAPTRTAPKITLVTSDGRMEQGWQASVIVPGSRSIEGYVPHFATCPKAKDFKR